MSVWYSLVLGNHREADLCIYHMKQLAKLYTTPVATTDLANLPPDQEVEVPLSLVPVPGQHSRGISHRNGVFGDNIWRI
jgi:hypothetical protein